MGPRCIAGAVLALAVGGMLCACSDEAPPAAPVVRPVKMLTVGESASGTREYPGRLRAGQQADMAFEVAGRIVEFPFREGETASAGAVLARLDDRDYVNLLEQAQAALNNRRTYLRRIAQAHETGAVSDQDMDDARAQVEVAAAEVKIRQKAVDDTVLRAPFDGVMSRKLVEDFANVQAKQPVLIFEDPSTMEIKVSVPERDLAARSAKHDTPEQITRRIQPKVIVTSLPDRVFPARLEELATTADPATRTFEATFVFDPGKDVTVLPGMTAKVIVTLKAEASQAAEVAIPARAAVADPNGQAAVWIVKPDDSVEMRPVTLGPLRGDEVFVRKGLANGDTVVVSGMGELRPGMKVRRWEREAAQ